MSEVLTAIKALGEKVDKAVEQAEAQGKDIAELKKKSTNQPTPNQVFGIRKGEDPLSSRPMYMAKAARVAIGQLDHNEAKLELEFSNKLKKALGGNYSGNQILIPLSWDMMPEDVRRDKEFEPYRKALHDSVSDIDPDILESRKLVQVYEKNERKYLRKTAMSYIDQSTGGALVQPPMYGDLIPILKNKAVLPNIGAVQVPLPAQGSIKYPRQTGVTTVYQVPENTAGTESNPTFDDITLEPKQFIGLVRVSNQLLTFAPGIAEAAIRNDMAEQIGLTFDLKGLEGTGGPNQVKGIINQPGIGTVTAFVTGADGNTFSPRDIARMIKKAMVSNSDIKTWIMRPDMWLGITESRADATVPGDAAGNYLFNMLRLFSDDFGETLRQRKVVTSNQISGSRTKGAGTALTYILGVDGQEIIIGMHGAMVLDANPYETTAFTSNQTLLRAILFGDVQVRRGAGVVFMDSLIVPNLDT